MRRFEIVLAILLPALLGALLFPSALSGSKALSSADVLYSSLPLSASAPANFRPHNPSLGDPANYWDSWLDFAAAEVRRGRLPLWNPYAACGMPLLGNPQAALFSPFTLFRYLITGPIATALACLCKVVIAGAGAYFLARRSGRSIIAASCACTAFALCGFHVTWLLYPLSSASVFLPWMLIGCEMIREGRGRAGLSTVAIVSALHLLSGHPETSFWLGAGMGAYMLALLPMIARGQRLTALGWFTGGQLLGILLATPQVLPFLEYLRQSTAMAVRSIVNPEAQFGGTVARSVAPLVGIVMALLMACVVVAARGIRGSPRTISILPWLFGLTGAVWLLSHVALGHGLFEGYPLLLLPDLYGNPVLGHESGGYGGPRSYNTLNGGYVGAITMLLAFTALFLKPRSARHTFASVLFLCALVVTLRLPPFSQLLNLLPAFDIAADNRSFPITTLFTSLLAAVGLDELTSATRSRGERVAALLGTCAVIAGAALGFMTSTIASHQGYVAMHKAVPQTATKPFGKIVEPRVEAIVTGATLRVSGFALDDHPLSDIRVFLEHRDGVLEQPARVGQAEPRPESAALKVYPEFERAGFTAELALPPAVRNGPAVVRVRITDSDGNVDELPRRRVILQPRRYWRSGIAFVVAAGVVLALLACGMRARWLALPLLALDLLAFARGYNSEIDAAQVKPEIPEIESLAASAPGTRLVGPPGIFPENMATKYRMRDVRGDDVMGVLSYDAFLRSIPASRSGMAFLIDPAGAFAALLDVRYSILPANAARPFPEATLANKDRIAVFERTDTQQRARFFAKVLAHDHLDLVQLAATPVIRKILEPLVSPLDTLLVEGGSAASPSDVRGEVAILRDLPCEVAVRATTNGPGYVFLCDTYFPGWQATVDGTPTEVQRADIAFRAVAVSAGTHEVVFRYRPASLRLGLLLCAAAGATLAMLHLLAIGMARRATAGHHPR